MLCAFGWFGKRNQAVGAVFTGNQNGMNVCYRCCSNSDLTTKRDDIICIYISFCMSLEQDCLSDAAHLETLGE
jgi:hypothetical protein